MKTVLWDWNGTLLDDVWTGTEAMNVLLKKYGKPLLRDTEEYRSVFCFPVSAYYEKMGVGGELFPVTSHEWMDEYNLREGRCTLREGACEALEMLKKAGCRQAVLSASKRENLLKQMGRYNVRPYFEEVLGLSHIYATSKVEIGREWLVEKQISPDDCVMIGDTLHDAEVANALGCRCILVNGGHQTRQILLESGCQVAENLLDAVQRILNSPDR